MFDIKDDSLNFSVTPFERVTDKDTDPITHSWDWINVYIEFSVCGLSSAFKTSFTVGELIELRGEVQRVQAALAEQTTTQAIFDSMERQIAMTFTTGDCGSGVSILLVLRPEGHAESAEIKVEFFIDQSYFSDIYRRIDEMINWEN